MNFEFFIFISLNCCCCYFTFSKPLRTKHSPDAVGKFQRLESMRPSQVFGDDLSEASDELTGIGYTLDLGNGRKLTRFRHTFDGIEVWDSAATLIVEEDSQNALARFPQGSKKLRMNLGKKKFNNQRRRGGRFRRSSSNDNSKVCIETTKFPVAESKLTNTYMYEMSDRVAKVELWDIRGKKAIEQEYCLVDTEMGTVIRTWQGIETFYGDGGNKKTGRYHYGTDRAKLPAIYAFPFAAHSRGKSWWKKQAREKCVMKTKDGHVTVIDMAGTDAPLRSNSSGDPAGLIQYQCQDGVDDSINGGYGPAADCFFFSDNTVKMLLDNSWGGADSIEQVSPIYQSLLVGVHYGESYDNAVSLFCCLVISVITCALLSCSFGTVTPFIWVTAIRFSIQPAVALMY